MSVESVLQRVATLEQALTNPTTLLATAARTGGTAAPATPLATAPEAATPSGSSFAEALQSASAQYGSAATSTGAGLASTASPTLPVSTAPALDVSTAPALTGTYANASTSLTPDAYDSSALAGASGVGALTPALSPSTLAANTGARIVAIAESQAGQTEQPPGSNESPAIAQYRTATAGAVPGAPWCAYFASWAARQAGAPLGAQGEGLGSVGEIWSWAQSAGRAVPNAPGVTPQPGDLIVFGDEHVGIVKAVLPNGDIQTIEGNYENKVSLNVRTPTEATGYVSMS
jgi:CHAP domain